jgi:hypothetical protein
VHHGASEPLFFVTSPINKHRRADARQGDPPLRHSTQNDNRQYAPDKISHISIHTEEAEPLSRSAPRGQRHQYRTDVTHGLSVAASATRLRNQGGCLFF